MKDLTERMHAIEIDLQSMRNAGRENMETLKYERLCAEWDTLKQERDNLKNKS